MSQDVENYQDIPKELLAKYTVVGLLWQTLYYKVYEVRSKQNSNEEYFIRTLNSNSDNPLYNYDLAATAFIQELLCLSSRLYQEEPLMVHDFQIENKLIGCVTRPYQ